jgi:septal ring factor EnvC (AmiA/AmiB activator)
LIVKSARQIRGRKNREWEAGGMASADEPRLGHFLRSTTTSQPLKSALQKVIAFRNRLAETGREVAHLEQKLKAITDDQVRLRANLEKVPPASAAYKRYLEKFDTQETEIEKLQTEIEQKHEAERLQRKEYEDFMVGLSVE